MPQREIELDFLPCDCQIMGERSVVCPLFVLDPLMAQLLVAISNRDTRIHPGEDRWPDTSLRPGVDKFNQPPRDESRKEPKGAEGTPPSPHRRSATTVTRPT